MIRTEALLMQIDNLNEKKAKEALKQITKEVIELFDEYHDEEYPSIYRLSSIIQNIDKKIRTS